VFRQTVQLNGRYQNASKHNALIRKFEDRLCRKADVMIIVRITINVLPEKQKEVVQTLLSMIGPMKKEMGCRSYALFYDMTDKNLLCVHEEWENREKLDQHLQSDMFGVLLGIKSLLCQSHVIQIFTVQQAEGMKAVLATRGKNDEGA